MENTYPKVLITWERITMEMETLRLEFKRKKQLSSYRKLKSLESEIRDLEIQIELGSDRERNAQKCLSEEVFSDASIKIIRHYSTKKMKKLQCLLDQKEKEEALRKYEDRNMDLDFEIANVLSQRNITSKIVSFSNILAPESNNKSVAWQWNYAVQKSRQFTSEITSWRLKMKDLPVISLNEEKQTKENIEEEIEILKMNLEEELKKIRAFESVLSKLNPSIFNEVENESSPHEYQNEEPTDQSTQSINERENIRKSTNANDTKMDKDERELNVEKLKNEDLSEVDGNLEDNQNKHENFNTADESEKVIDNNEEVHQEDGRSHKEYRDNDLAFQLLRNEGIIAEQKNDNNTENVFELKEKFQNEYGIIIESISQTDLSYDVKVWDSDERLKVVESKVFPDGFRLDTDIFYIKESTVGNSQGNEQRVVRDVLLKVLLPMENNSYYEYKGAVKFGNAWRLIDCICQDMYMVFKVKEVESFCVLSFVRQEKSTVLPTGSQFISEIDNRIQVTFPPNAVSKGTQLSFKIYPVNTNFILEKITDPPNDEVYAITSSLSTTHMKFKKMFKVQLPLFTISNLCHEPEYINYNILKWNDTGLFQVTDIQPVISNGLVCFETNSFSGYCCVGTKRPQISSSLESFVPEIYGLRKWCKILFFVGKISNNSIPIMLECVELQRVSEVCEKRTKYGYHLVSEWISRDLFFTPNSTIVSVEVKGRFKIPKESSVKRPRLSFIPVARDNFSHFLVELRGGGGGVAYGILSLRVESTVLYEIYYYPDSTKKPAVPLNKVWNPIIKESITKGSSTKETETKENKGKTVNITNFFTEKGLLSLSENMNPDTMLKFCLHMNMTSVQYDTIRQRDGYTAMGNLKVIQTALNQQPQKGKLNLVFEALTQAGQRDLAEKVAELHSNKKPLHTI